MVTTPPERSSKLAPRWKGPFFIKRVPNAYQVTYEDDMVWRTVHINHVKPAKTPAGGFPVPMSTPEPPMPPPVYLPRSYQWKRPAKPPQPAALLQSRLNQPPLLQSRLNQPPLPQSPPSQPPRHTQPRLPRVGPPHAHQPVAIRPLVLSPGHQPLLGGPMRIRGWVNLCGALHGSILLPCA